MFRNKKRCEKCENIYDMMDYECSHCHNPNEDFYQTKTSDRVVNIPLLHQILVLGIGLFGLNVLTFLVEVFVLAFNGFNNDVLKEAGTLALTVSISYFTLFAAMMVFVILNRTKFIRPFTHWAPYVSGIVGGAAILGLSIAYSALVQQLYPVGDNANQTAVVDCLKASPFVIFIVLSFIGPFCEELTYRVGLFSLLNRWSKIAAYLISLFVFAFIHFDFTALITLVQSNDPQPLIVELLNIPSYLIAGAALAFLYDRFGFASSLTAHIVNNVYSCIMILVMG